MLAAACSSPSSYYPDVDEAELELEEAKHQAIYDQATIEKHERYIKRRFKVEQRLVDVSTKVMKGGVKLCEMLDKGDTGCFFSFELAKTSKMEAYSDGKKIVVSPSMMSFMKKDEDLALVLGHEYAHNLMGHIKAKQKNAMIGNVLGAVLDGLAATQGINTTSMFGNLGAIAGGHGYSQEFEKEADYLGLYIAALAGYDITDAAEVWRKMSTKFGGDAIHNGTSHPTNPERYIAIETAVKEIQNKQHEGVVLMPNMKDS